MGYLGVTTDWSTIQAMQETVDEKGRCLQVQRGGSGAVAEGVEDATADACRADAMAAIVLGERSEDGSITWDRDQVAVTVNVVMDLDTLRGESDQIALVDGQPVPGGDRPRDRGVRHLVAPAGDRPGRRAPPRLRHERRTCPSRCAASSSPVTVAAARPGARTWLARACRWTTPRSSPTARAAQRTAARCARRATSSRPPGSPTSPTPGPTGPATGPPPGARPSTSRPDRSFPIEPDPPPIEPRTTDTRRPATFLMGPEGMPARRHSRDAPSKNRQSRSPTRRARFSAPMHGTAAVFRASGQPSRAAPVQSARAEVLARPCGPRSGKIAPWPTIRGRVDPQ